MQTTMVGVESVFALTEKPIKSLITTMPVGAWRVLTDECLIVIRERVPGVDEKSHVQVPVHTF